MSKLLLQVNWTTPNTDGSFTSKTFTDVTRVNIKQGIKPDANYAEISLKNPPSSKYGRIEDGTIIHEHVSDAKELLFKEGDTIKIYAARITQNRDIDTSSTSNDLLMSSFLEEIKCNGTQKESKIVLKAVDKTYALLNKLWNYAYISDNAPSTGWTAPVIVRDVIKSVNDSHDDPEGYSYGSTALIPYGPFAISAEFKSVGGYIEDTRPDGSNFPTTTMAKVFAPAYEFIKEASAPEQTNSTTEQDDENLIVDRNMIFYIDERNRFHWFYPRDVVETTLNETLSSTDTTITLTNASSFASDGRIMIGSELIDYTGKSSNDLTGCTRGVGGTVNQAHSTGDTVTSAIIVKEGDTTAGTEVLSLNLTKKTFDVVNMVIYNAGQDLYGSGILWYYYNTATNEKDLKMVYKPWTHIAKNLIEQEIARGNLIANTAGSFTFQQTLYQATAYPFITTWTASVSSNATYNTSLRNRAAFNNGSVGQALASALTNKTGSPRWKGNVDLNGYRFRPGDVIRFTSNRFGIQNVSLRINDVTQSIDKSSWTTNIEVEEDEPLQ